MLEAPAQIMGSIWKSLVGMRTRQVLKVLTSIWLTLGNACKAFASSYCQCLEDFGVLVCEAFSEVITIFHKCFVQTDNVNTLEIAGY